MTEENIFIVACCEDKGVSFLQGKAPLGVRYKEEKAPKPAAAVTPPPVASPAPTGDTGVYTVTVDGRSYHVQVAPGTGQVASVNPAPPVAAAPAPPPAPATTPAPSADAGEAVVAPMPGSVFKVIKNDSDQVAEGEVIVIMEAMKMEVEIKAPKGGTLSLHVQQGDSLAPGQTIATIA